ncbi:Flp family type IVb pilin [Actinoplanes sp. NPDC026670]|uniref:Flp family type IVb pilin n=1 Tax=Actinoplanes sp. NPDC026670 TaxID=3154700 RepID=UPI0034027E3F
MEKFKLLIGYLRAKHSSDQGATIVEYSLLVALIAVALIVGLQALETDIAGVLKKITDNI